MLLLLRLLMPSHAWFCPLQIINATVAVVAANISTITKTFYPRMFANNPEVLAFFNQANQRSSRQPEALAHSIVASVTHINNLKDIEP